MRSLSRHTFTLIELLIVIGPLGALATLVLPQVTATRTEAMDPIVQKEMQDIRLAFQRFCQDVVPTDAQLDEFRKYGLAPLMRREISGEYAFDEWDDDRAKGWRGPYLTQEGTRHIAAPNASSNGQDDAGSEVTIPVIQDPYSESDSDGRFYRVMCRKNGGSDWVPGDLALVFVGLESEDSVGASATSLLDTSPVDTAQTEWADKYSVGANEELVKQLVFASE
jgi:type II secretory pathway pseudopilin PulG